MPQPWPWVKVMERSSSTFPQTHIFFVPNIKGLAQTVLMWEGKVFAAADADADAAETDWKHKVTPERGDLINIRATDKFDTSASVNPPLRRLLWHMKNVRSGSFDPELWNKTPDPLMISELASLSQQIYSKSELYLQMTFWNKSMTPSSK